MPQALIGDTADVKTGMPLECAQILVEEVIQGEDAKAVGQCTTFFGSTNPISAVRSSAVIANRTTPAT